MYVEDAPLLPRVHHTDISRYRGDGNSEEKNQDSESARKKDKGILDSGLQAERYSLKFSSVNELTTERHRRFPKYQSGNFQWTMTLDLGYVPHIVVRNDKFKYCAYDRKIRERKRGSMRHKSRVEDKEGRFSDAERMNSLASFNAQREDGIFETQYGMLEGRVGKERSEEKRK